MKQSVNTQPIIKSKKQHISAEIAISFLYFWNVKPDDGYFVQSKHVASYN